ncbi:basement membrane-specific heparan sulfate proteoglycan core protein isoform X5 [Lepisosteus oculatus]|uniref:basement membrane-specific heparan sulfate proteoglycan core protein isoform X5 n=1 Tax=Lepisosteus oculatus TaxID=7918 RepID=UPI003724B16B
MGTSRTVCGVSGLIVTFVLTSQLIYLAQGSKVWGEVSLPEDLEPKRGGKQWDRLLAESDDEDFAADEPSGDEPSGEEDGSTPEPSIVSTARATTPSLESLLLREGIDPDHREYIYYRALVNFTDSIEYVPELEDILSSAFEEISAAIVDTLESEYNKIPGTQTVNVVLIKKLDGFVFVELDVGSENNSDEEEIRSVLYSVVLDGSIASYVTSVEGFQFRRLGAAESLPPVEAMISQVIPSARTCMPDEFTCQDGECVPLEYRCDNRLDCHDMSDELDCPPATPAPVIPGPSPPLVTVRPEIPSPPIARPCRVDEAVCQNGQCIPRDYLCDGERDCTDGSDEIKCGTPSPCEPNEFKCQNGRCALKLWRCDGDNDCGDNSDESYCPTKRPDDACAPEEFMCLGNRACIPASYQCDEEADCSDRSDEIGCTPPEVTTPPKETVMAVRGETVTFTCVAVGVPTPMITWRLNWGHIPISGRILMTSDNGRGTLTIRDVKDADQGAYTCEAINAKGMVFGIPDGVLILKQQPGNCPEGHFSIHSNSRCVPCFCFGISQQCLSTSRYRNQIRLRFTEEEDFKGVNVSFPSRLASPPLSSSQTLIDPEMEEFQLVDLSRRFLILDSYWTLPSQFLGNKIDSYGGSLKYKVRYTLARGETEPATRPDVIIVGNGQRLVYRQSSPTVAGTVNQRDITFTEENWEHSSGRPVTREDLMMTLVNLESISIRTVYDNKMVSVSLSDIVMDTTTVENSGQAQALTVEECRCPPGYSGLSCETCSAGFERVSGGPYLGTCAGCSCNGHASACDPISGYCLNCQHNTEGPRCDKCLPGYFGNPQRGRPDDCKPCPCPYSEISRRFSDTCFIDTDGQATCDNCLPGYTGRRCERCAAGYQGNPLQPNGKCVPVAGPTCDSRGVVTSSSRLCTCKPNVIGAFCDECKIGTFHLTQANPEGCLQCFCMGVTSQCASSSWSRDQVRAAVDGEELFTLSNGANTRTISQGIIQRSSSELAYRSFANIPSDIYYWVLPGRFRGDKVTSYGGELRYTIRYEPGQRSRVIEGSPDVVLQGNGIFLEHFSQTKPVPRVPTTITVPLRESAWKRADGHLCTREHLLMALADTTVFMIRATYADSMSETSIADIRMDIAVPHPTGQERALEVEECACPQGYKGPSCQECDAGYIRTGSGLYLGTCERCDCNGHASSCDPDTGECLQCLHNTAGPHCESCLPGFYGNPRDGSPGACRPCPCPGTSSDYQFSRTCFLDSDGQPTCDNCPSGFTGRRCERCASGFIGNPQLGQRCYNGSCSCDSSGSVGCDSSGKCKCKMHTEGPTCGSCKQGHFHLSADQKDGCLSCFCMGVTQQCTSSSYYRDVVSTTFAPGNFQNFALVNRQRSTRITTGFTVEVATDGTQLSYSNFGSLSQEASYWQLPEVYQGDKKEAFFARMRRAHKKDSSLTEEQLRKDASIWGLMDSMGTSHTRSKRASKSTTPAEELKRLDDEIWALISNFSNSPGPLAPPGSIVARGPPASRSFSSPPGPPGPPAFRAPAPAPPPPPPAGSPVSSSARVPRPSSSLSASPGRSPQPPSSQSVLQAQRGTNLLPPRGPRPGGSEKYALVYKGFSLLPEGLYYWQLPQQFKGDKVGSYGGRLKYTISYVAGPRGSPVEDADVQIIGNDITLVARQPWPRGQSTRESRSFEVVFREEHWHRPDGMPATREHLMMVLADLDEILIRASHHTEMRSVSISGVSMEVAVPAYTGLRQALEVEHCRCPPGYQGLSCQDCAHGYSRTGGGLYLGHCELCDCNGHSESCHPETGVCTNCLHNTVGELCEQCAPGFYGDPTAGTPEDCQPCACPHTDPDSQFSPTCESLGNGGYRCTDCQPGYTGQYCERCAPGYVGNPQEREKCRPYNAASLVVKVYPERTIVSQGSAVTLRCQVTGSPPHYFFWTREDGRPLPSTADKRRQGEELFFSNIQPSDAGAYICTCRDLRSSNRSRAEIVVTTVPSKPIEVTVEEPKVQTVKIGSTVSFICTAKSKSPAYTLVWTRQNNSKLPSRAMDFNGILTIHNVQPEDAGAYVCTGSNMFAMDEGTAFLYVPEASKTQMFYTAYEMFEGHRPPNEESQPFATIQPPVLRVQRGQRAEFRCTVRGNPTPSIEWAGGQGNRISSNAVIREGVLIIPAAERSDEAEYICKALNVHGEHAARATLYVNIDEDARPFATIQPPVLTIQQGQQAEFRCSVRGNPTPAIEWSGGRGNRITPKAIIRDGVLIIPAAERSDEAEYICKALNVHGEHTARAVLYVHSASLPHIQVSPPRVTIQEGETLRLYCRAGGTPSPSLTWKKQGGELPPQAIPSHGFHQFKSNSVEVLQKRIEELQARMERTDIGTLLIPSIKASDAGTYLCVGTNSIGSSEAPIEVSVLRVDRVVAPVIQPSKATVQEGRTLELSCVVTGSPPPSITWLRSSGPLSANHQVVGSKLRILHASPADSGDYICQVNSGHPQGVTQQSVISVTVTSSPASTSSSTSSSSRLQTPIISIEPHSAAVRPGESTSFRCRVYSGAQPIRIEWKMTNSQPLQDNVKIGPDGSVITIAKARPANQGTYRCVASNLFGITQSVVSLIVKVPPQVTVTPKGPVRVKVGEPINLECQATGEPRPAVTWHRSDTARRIVLSSPVPMDSNAVMQILAARPEDSGTYGCMAKNSEGSSEVKVDVVVEGGPLVTSAPIASAEAPLVIVVEGDTTTLHCTATGHPPPTITWSKLRAPLPWQHKVVNNSLILPNVGRQDSGQYICNATNTMGTAEITIIVDVESPPYATSLPDSLAVRVGEVIRLQCLAHGTPPLTYKWTKVDGVLPTRAEVRDGTLQIDLATVADAGTYKCLANNKVGNSEALATVTVRSPLAVRVSPRIEVKAPGSAVEFTCSATGGIQTRTEWLKEGGALPRSHHIYNGVLRIENLHKSDEGNYICRATSVYGQAQDTAKLTIQALPKVMINVRTSVQTVMVGNAVEFECQAIGDPQPTLQWSKVGSQLPAHIIVKNGMLTIGQVKESDAGLYRCTATNEVGSVQSEVVLNVQSIPQIAAQPEVKEVTVGSAAVFPCMASGYPVPQIKWTKLDGKLPPRATVEGNVLTIPSVTPEDMGTYVCTASNKQGKVQAFSMLKVHERVVPYFTQTPISYLTLPTIKNAYKAFHIKVTFRPDTVDGLILYAGMIIYNGQKRTTGADFISLGLVGGRPEFRFDVGSGMATIRYPTPLTLGEFHTVELFRNLTQGSLTVDDNLPVSGSSQGKFQGLDLNEELYVGGYPDYDSISKTTGLKSGFVGCIRQLIVQGEEVIFKDLDRSSRGISNCPTCKDRPCQNGGVCRDSDTSSYICECLQGFTGSNCEHSSALHCHPEACGPDATCINKQSGIGYNCRCHLGKSGEKCMDGTLVTTPSFDGSESYISYPPLTNIHNDLRIDLEFKPYDMEGLMFFSGGKKMKVEDFVSLALVDSYVEFRFELGTGLAVLRSMEPITMNQWHRVTAERLNKDGMLKVDQQREVRRSSPGKAQGLNIHTPMYLGGVPSFGILPKPANISMLFDGCIGEVSINGKKVDLSYSFTESKNIQQCVDQSPCDRMLCLNGGTCFAPGEYELQCLCRDGFEGERCEISKDICQLQNPCQNGGRCSDNQCLCPAGYTGQFCEKRESVSSPESQWRMEGNEGNDSPIQYAAHFYDDGYLALPKVIFPRSSPEAPETIELEMRSTSTDGLVFWQGVELGENGKGKDFVSLGLENGYLVFSYQLGSGEAEIRSEVPVNDGKWHKITAVRTGRQGSIQIDGGQPVRGESEGRNVMVDTKGNIYLGGAPDIATLTGGKFVSGITGCLKNLVLMNAQPGEQPPRPVDLRVHAEEGVNVKKCSA